MSNRFLIFSLSFLFISSLHSMEIEGALDTESSDLDSRDYIESNVRMGSTCIGGGLALCAFAPFNLALLVGGAAFCWHGLHHCAIACNEREESVDSRYESNIRHVVRFVFCLRDMKEQ